MKILLILAAIMGAIMFYMKSPSASSIVMATQVGETITFNHVSYSAEWGASEDISGYVSRLDRHYSESVPVIIFDMVLTSKDFANPNVVTITHNGNGNYSWTSKTRPEGEFLVCHLVLGSLLTLKQLEDVKQGDTIKITAKVSQNNALKSDSGFFSVNHDNHKILYVENIQAL